MFEDKYIFKFICVLLGTCSIFIRGPIIPIISVIVAIGMLVYRIKKSKESPEDHADFMLDVMLVAIVIIINIVLLTMFFIVENHIDSNDNYSSSSSQELSASEFAETVIFDYQLKNFEQFSEKGNHLNAIKKGFTSYLKEDLGLSDVTVNGNKITCTWKEKTVIFTVSKNDISYSVK